MLRALSLLLLVAGLLASGLGLAALLETSRLPALVSGEAAPVEDSLQAEANEPAPLPVSPGAGPARLAGETAPAMNDDLAFQPMMEPPPAPASASATASGGSLQNRLRTVPVAHETPANATYRRSFEVTFAIDATGDTSAADALPGRGVQETGEARVSDRAEVRLSGAGFEIAPASPPVQLLSPLTENTWRWRVTPVEAGEQDLVFEVFALVGQDILPVRTYRDTVTVRVSGLGQAIALADEANPIVVLLGGIGSILAGLIGAARFVFRK